MIDPTNTSKDSLAKLGEGFAVLLNDPDAKKKLVDSIMGKASAAGNSMPYYKEKFGQRLKPIIDDMLQDGEPRIVRYIDYPGVSRNTLALKHQQALKWLSDNLHGYLGINDKFTVHRGRSGVIIKYWPDGVHDEDVLGIGIARKIDDNTDREEVGALSSPTEKEKAKADPLSVLNKVRNFIDNSAAGALRVSCTGMSTSDMTIVKELIAQVEQSEPNNVIGRIDSEVIKIIRIKPRPEDPDSIEA